MPDLEGENPPLAAPTILDRSRHPISRRNIDPDALKVLNRLHQHGFISYLVGGAVRDLMLGRIPQDFDVGTNARPRQIKKLFRNAFLIGRRFRFGRGPRRVGILFPLRILVVGHHPRLLLGIGGRLLGGKRIIGAPLITEARVVGLHEVKSPVPANALALYTQDR